jgi:hypothetical protein
MVAVIEDLKWDETGCHWITCCGATEPMDAYPDGIGKGTDGLLKCTSVHPSSVGTMLPPCGAEDSF